MVATLGEAYDAGWGIWVGCAYGNREGLKSIRECDRRLDVDMQTLLWTRGRDFPLALLQERMRCSRCGSRKVRVHFVVPTNGKRASA